jgi:hypothetical protein
MDQSRRGFLKMLSMAIPVAAAAPSYFFAPAGGWACGGIISGGDPIYIGSVYRSCGELFIPPEMSKRIIEASKNSHLMTGQVASEEFVANSFGPMTSAEFILAANPAAKLVLLRGDFERYLKYGHRAVSRGPETSLFEFRSKRSNSGRSTAAL